jgi:hypothetical protein
LGKGHAQRWDQRFPNGDLYRENARRQVFLDAFVAQCQESVGSKGRGEEYAGAELQDRIAQDAVLREILLSRQV